MNKFLLLTLIAIAACKNIILIGDSRFVGMGVGLMGFPYATITQYYGTGTNVRSTSAKSYGGHSFQCTAQVGASSYTFKSGSDIYNSMINQLKKAASGTIVIFWLGINDPSAVESTFNFYAGLAKNYKSLKFYAFSITGVNANKIKNISNNDVKNFNSKISTKISNANISNLKYRSIVDGNDVNTVLVGGSKVNILNYSTDGLHYGNSGYSQIWQAMNSKI